MNAPGAEVNAPGAEDLSRVLVELRALEREIAELEYVRRSDALERVREAIRHLGELGSPQGILERAAAELGTSSQFDRVLLSEVVDGILRPRSEWSRNGAATSLAELEQSPLKLEYPLIEEEVARRQSAELVLVANARSRTPARLARLLGWDRYVVGALTVDGGTAGLLHADATDSGRALDELDREVVALYCEGLAGVFERAVLRETLRRHRSELQSAVQWMSGRLTRLSAEDAALPAAAGPAASTNLESLTKRELDVLRLMARGQTNQLIAGALLVREGTVKYHVKNILRKLGATSRADAVGRYLRASAGQTT
jgi:LuxR family transcriptional regulator, regulator of acetate metabolism